MKINPFLTHRQSMAPIQLKFISSVREMPTESKTVHRVPFIFLLTFNCVGNFSSGAKSDRLTCDVTKRKLSKKEPTSAIGKVKIKATDLG